MTSAESISRGAGITELGGFVLALDLPEPADPEADDVLIEVVAAGVAYRDDIVRTGGWNVGTSSPMAIRVEAAGVVRSVGPAVARLRPGDEVLTNAVPLRQGTWAHLCPAPENQVARKPPDMSFEEADVLPVPVLTAAEVLLCTVMVRPGEVLLVNGGGGITGGLLVAVGAQIGARVIATAAPRGSERVRRYGAGAVVDYRRPGWRAEVRRLAGGAVPPASPSAA